MIPYELVPAINLVEHYGSGLPMQVLFGCCCAIGWRTASMWGSDRLEEP